jgi:cytochrome c
MQRKFRQLGVAGCAVLLGGFLTPAAGADDTAALLAQYRCTTCHTGQDAVTGPSWQDIATRYHGRKQAEVLLAAKIRAGARGGSFWHMPPHPEVSKRDAETIAAYILAAQ